MLTTLVPTGDIVTPAAPAARSTPAARFTLAVVNVYIVCSVGRGGQLIVLQTHHVRTPRTRLAVGVLVGLHQILQVVLERVLVVVGHALAYLVSMDQLGALGVQALDFHHTAAVLHLRLYVIVDARVAGLEATANTLVQVDPVEAYLTLELLEREALVKVLGGAHQRRQLANANANAKTTLVVHEL